MNTQYIDEIDALIESFRQMDVKQRFDAIDKDTHERWGTCTSSTLLMRLDAPYKRYRDNCYWSGDNFNAHYRPYSFFEWIENGLPKSPIDDETPNAVKI